MMHSRNWKAMAILLVLSSVVIGLAHLVGRV